MHKSVHKSSVPDSYILLLFIVKSYLNDFVCVYTCMYQEHLKNHNKFLVSAHTWANKANSDSEN